MTDLLIPALILIIVGEFLYIISLRSNIRRIAKTFAEKRGTDTNTLVSVSMLDSQIRNLVNQLNGELMELRKEKLCLSQGDLELKKAVTNIAHDLRTPLTAISGYLELLEEEETSERAGHYLNIIRERTDALKRLTEELFRYSIITSTEDDLQLTDSSLKGELEMALIGAYGMLTEKGIEPEIQMPEQDVRRELNHDAIQRVFSNILTNTSKYSEGDLGVTLKEDGKIIFENQASGLSEVEVSQLFDRFYTVSNARESTGLGLSIARSLTEKMGGRITAHWKDGRIYIVLKF